MNYLSIDLWDKICWIAYLNMWIIFTLKAIPRTKLIQELKKIIPQKQISKIIVWMPYDLYWIDNKQLNKTKIFVNKLQNFFPNMQIETIDERFTTFESTYILKKIKEKNIKEKKDSLSAYLILETYLNKKTPE